MRIRHLYYAPLLALSAGALAACGDSPTKVVPVASVEVSAPWTTLSVGEMVLLKAMPLDVAGNPLADRPVDWSSSDTTVASVSSSGLVRAKGAGRATIAALSEQQTGQLAITVTGR